MVRGPAAVQAGAMTETPLPPAPGTEGPRTTGPRTTGEEARDLGRIRRSTTDRKVAGVAGGLGRHLDVDPLLLRVAFVVLTFFGGAGLIVYAAGWLLVPQDDGTEAAVRLEDRTRSVVLAVVGVIAGVSVVAELAGNAWGPWFPWQLVVAATREALTNAAKHAGTGRVDVYAEVGPAAVEVFVRDRGTGFDLGAVPADRLGVRGSIIDRMLRHGGRAEIRTAPGEGTEVRLNLPRTAEQAAPEQTSSEQTSSDPSPTEESR